MILALALHLAATGQASAPVPPVPLRTIRTNALPFEDRRIRVCGVLENHPEMDRYYVYERTEYDIAAGVYLSAKPGGARVGERTCMVGRTVYAIPRAKRDLTVSFTTDDAPVDIAYSLVIEAPRR